MARKKKATQPRLFKQEIPEMPEGYYSSGPNPNLHAFVEAHALPYDPQSDDYRMTPYDQPITTTKSTLIYGMHPYHLGKKPHDAIREYIRHYTSPGDLVLDPMCGSGSTALAALMDGRAAIAIDRSPAATFITKGYCTPVDTSELQAAFRRLKNKVKSEIDWLYETRCDRCDGRATVAYTVHSQTYRCPRCLEVFPLFDCVEAQGETRKGKPKKIVVCPHCYRNGQLEEIKTTGQHFGVVPVLTSYVCQEGCSPRRSQRSHNDADPVKRRYFENYDIVKIQEIERLEVPYWYPDAELAEKIPYRMLYKKDFRPSDASRLVDLFTKRNLWALAAILSAADSNDDLRLIIQASILASSRRAQHLDGGGGYIPGTYHLPQMSKERNVLGVVERIAKKAVRARTEISRQLESTSILISTKTSTSLTGIPSNSVDYIFTDPPYGGTVQYAELNFLWEAWMKFDVGWHDEEIIVNEARGKTESAWERLMAKVFSECYRVLKPGHWLSLCYHDTSEGTWQSIQDLMSEVGFISEELDAVLSIDTGGRTYNQYTASKVTKRDLVVNFRKPRADELPGQLLLDFDAQTFEQEAVLVLRNALDANPGAPADRLYDDLVSRMVRRGTFERHDFDALLRSVAEPVSEPHMRTLFEAEPPNLFGTHETVRWYLKATADVADEAESAKEEAAAARLEAFMHARLEAVPDEPGVHYSDLFEQYLPVQDKPRRMLADWMPEYFFKTPEGTWRPPANDEERTQKAELRASGALRRIKRFARALLEGVPPADRDRPENPATAADWLRQCRRAGLYEYGRALYEKGGFDFSALSEVAQLEVEEDYRVCVRRSG